MENRTPERIRVLLVDDDEEDIFLITKIFAKIVDSPFDVEAVSSFHHARQLITQEVHDLYLIDYRLGEKSGLDLLRHAHPEKRREPFILLTGAGDRDVEVRSMKLAASDYLVKGSFDAEMLARTLRYALQRKIIEQQRIESLIELNRNKDEFISLASHQLRTPASGVKQYLGMVLEGFVGEVDPAQRALLERAYASNERQLRIVTDLLKVAQVDAGKVMLKKADVHLNDMVRDVLAEQQGQYDERRQTVTFTPARSNPTAFVDHGSIRMVIENIIDNAGKYSEEGARVEVRTYESDDQVCVAVTDEGVGIDPTSASRLFEKFSRLDNALSTKVGGTGLGLYWAKKIVTLHDGMIIHEPNPTGGTIFTVCLPKQPKV